MVGFDDQANRIKHYRVDKMLNICSTDSLREGRNAFNRFDLADYTYKMFAMFDGKEQMVKIMFENELAGIAIDRFGKDVVLIPMQDGKHFTITVRVAVSRQFLGWIMSLGAGVEIIGPKEVVEQMRTEA